MSFHETNPLTEIQGPRTSPVSWQPQGYLSLPYQWYRECFCDWKPGQQQGQLQNISTTLKKHGLRFYIYAPTLNWLHNCSSKPILCHLLLVVPLLPLCPGREEPFQESHALVIETVRVRCHHRRLPTQWTLRIQTTLKSYSTTKPENMTTT